MADKDRYVSVTAVFNGQATQFNAPRTLQLEQLQAHLSQTLTAGQSTHMNYSPHPGAAMVRLETEEEMRGLMMKECAVQLVLVPACQQMETGTVTTWSTWSTTHMNYTTNQGNTKLSHTAASWECSSVPEQRGPGRSAARFVADVTLPPNTEVLAGTQLTKIWTVRNGGTCFWPTGSKLVQIGGDEMGGSPTQVPAVTPGHEQQISVDLQAPSRPGRYVSYWRMQDPQGRRFGQRIWCEFIVIEPESAPSCATTQAEQLLAQHEELVQMIMFTAQGNCELQKKLQERMVTQVLNSSSAGEGDSGAPAEVCPESPTTESHLLGANMVKWLQLNGPEL
eukprot:TRINITY_DN26255_c0_g3_i2.p1 TRINITY_DN26255_c0_g3~~TRINITY_DN26255_c0_g3_i2.p1  ORF type:complete len:336 (+),score=59.66 TRINITY_DN26255_c0_g3_i2:69-1076(+)